MHKTNFGSLSVLQFDNLGKEKFLTHCITTKEGWKTGEKPRLSVSDQYPWKEYRNELAKSLDISPEKLFIPKQTHSNSVAVITERTLPEDLTETDALVTNEKGLCLTIQTADCVPVFLFDQESKAIGIIHAGWRGTVSKIVQKTIEKMSFEYGTHPQNLVAGIGPSIYKHAYEVGNDVITKVIEQFPNYRALLSPSRRDGKAFFDLWEANKSLLIESGVPTENIEIMGMCSYEQNQLFFSARRDGFDTGRIISCLMLQ